jgi:hypothetical protein
MIGSKMAPIANAFIRDEQETRDVIVGNEKRTMGKSANTASKPPWDGDANKLRVAWVTVESGSL